jgi:hypothetical protein
MADVIFKPFNDAKPTVTAVAPSRIDLFYLLYLHGTRIQRSNFNQNDDGTEDMYEVGEGKYFYLLSVQFCVAHGGTTGQNSGRVYSIIPGSTVDDSNTLLYSRLEGGLIENSTAAISPCMPLLFVPGEVIRLYNQNSRGMTSASLVGIEIDKRIIDSQYTY